MLFALFIAQPAVSQERNYAAPPMLLDIGSYKLSMNKLNGEGGLQSQYSWMLTGSNPASTELFYWPADQYQSNMLYQIYNPVALDDSGIIDQFGVRQSLTAGGGNVNTNTGITDWSREVRRYRPPTIVVDGIKLNPPYKWQVDPALLSDIKLEFEDVLPQYGIRSRVEMYAFANPDHDDYFIWKATHKFTGELRRPREASTPLDTLPDQTITLWWPLAFSFGPSKAGERATLGGFSFEGEDDLDDWLKAKSPYVSGTTRDSLVMAYYYDWKMNTPKTFTNGSMDDTGDPDAETGRLHSPQIAGYTLLHADKSASIKTDDPAQPYSMPHADIAGVLWGTRGNILKMIYRGDDAAGNRWPGPYALPKKGPMRFITNGPYTLTKNRSQQRYDSISFVYAVGVGSIGWKAADSIGKAWMNKQITDSDKNAWLMKGRDTLFDNLAKAHWAWERINKGLPVPAPPPPPDISVTSGPDKIEVQWSYPDVAYFKDPATGVDDWQSWRVYKKRGAFLVNDPLDQKSGEVWDLVFETTNRAVTTFTDNNVQRGVDYYYAVTATDNGTQNTFGIVPGKPLESSRYVTRSLLPAVPFKPGLNTSSQVRVVPNPATIAAGALSFAGTPNKILFVNLPFICTLRIYTETGDFVKEIVNDKTGDQEWDQRTDNNQYVTSGIYILVVTDARDAGGKALDNQFVKFVLVR